VVMW